MCIQNTFNWKERGNTRELIALKTYFLEFKTVLIETYSGDYFVYNGSEPVFFFCVPTKPEQSPGNIYYFLISQVHLFFIIFEKNCN